MRATKHVVSARRTQAPSNDDSIEMDPHRRNPNAGTFGPYFLRALIITITCCLVFGLPATPARASARSVTEADLLTAEVPAYCKMPRQRLVHGKTTKGRPGIGGIQVAAFDGTATVAYGDFAKLGYRQALTVYGCSAGNVAWPDVLILVGAKGKLLASFPLDQINNHREHAAVSGISASGTHATVSWTEYEGAGSEVVKHVNQVSYRKGRLVVATD